MSEKKYAVHPGVLKLGNGRTIHMSVSQVATGYRLKEGEYVQWDHRLNHEDYVHLYPSDDHSWKIPEVSEIRKLKKPLVPKKIAAPPKQEVKEPEPAVSEVKEEKPAPKKKRRGRRSKNKT